jgi:hypothetical protein
VSIGGYFQIVQCSSECVEVWQRSIPVSPAATALKVVDRQCDGLRRSNDSGSALAVVSHHVDDDERPIGTNEFAEFGCGNNDCATLDSPCF